MKYKPLVGKETLAKDFIRSVHHVWGSVENCSTTQGLLCDKWLAQLLTTKHMPVLPLWEAPQSSSYAIGLFWRPNTWTGHSQHQNFFQLSPRAPGWPMKTCPEHKASTSHQKQACLRRIGSMTTPFINSLSLSLPPLACAKTLWKHKPTLRSVSYPVMESLIQNCTNTVQEFTGQRHLFVSKYWNLIENASRTAYKPPFLKTCTVA